MSSTKFSDDFKRDAVAQITDRGYPVREVAERLGVSQYSLYSWKKKFAKASSGDAEKEAEKPGRMCSTTSRCSTTRSVNTPGTECCRPSTSSISRN